jgi:hypothetical protein
MGDPEEIRTYFERETSSVADRGRLIVNKAPANAPFLAKAARAFPESRFIFIIRDPRDVLVSHQRGTADWMKGANSTVEGCMQKIQRYFKGWQEAENLPNVKLIRYEDLHQNFFETMEGIFDFVGAQTSPAILSSIYEDTNFAAQTNRSNVEVASAAKRKGVIGEWGLQLKKSEKDWYSKAPFFQRFMNEHGYAWTETTYANILKAMQESGANFLDEDDLLSRHFDPERPNIILQHDIDFLTKRRCAESVVQTARIEAELDVPAAYNFLPLDDRRYERWPFSLALRTIKRVQAASPRAYIGLHVNACERLYPPDAPDAGLAPPDLGEIEAYTRQQIADYRQAGLTFRTATAHGYGRAKKLPNNRDLPVIGEILKEEGIALFDADIRKDLSAASRQYCAITDVGGILKPRYLNNGYALTDPRAYSSLPGGAVLRFLTHPGNYPVSAPATIIMRVFATDDQASPDIRD